MDNSLSKLILREGRRFSYFHLIRVLQRLSTGTVPLGERGPFVRESVLLRHDPALRIQTGDISAVEQLADGRTAVTSAFLGLIGPTAPLAMAFSEQVVEDVGEERTALRDFYDVIHHRLLSLLVRGWLRHRLAETVDTAGGSRTALRLLALCGGTPGQRGLTTAERLRMAPALSLGSRSPRVLRAAVAIVTGAHVELECFIESKAQLAAESRMALGRRRSTLAGDLVLGSAVGDRSSRFRLVVGPVNESLKRELLPGGRLYARLRDVVRDLAPPQLDPELEVVEKAAETPRFALAVTARLGGDTFLGARKTQETRTRFLLTESAADANTRVSPV